MRRTPSVAVLALSFAAIAFVGCAPQPYAYVPVAPATPTQADMPTGALSETTPTPAIDAIEPSATNGSVRLASYGVAKIPGTTRSDGGASPSVHLRMTVTNRSADTWTVNGAEQRLEIGADDGGRVAVYALTASGQRAPTIDVPSGEARVVDLFYPLPDGVKPGKDLPRFDAVWSVQSGRAAVSDRTVFERVAVRSPNTGDVDSRSYFNDPFNAAGTYPDSAPESVGYPFPQSGPTRSNPRMPNPRPNED